MKVARVKAIIRAASAEDDARFLVLNRGYVKDGVFV